MSSSGMFQKVRFLSQVYLTNIRFMATLWPGKDCVLLLGWNGLHMYFTPGSWTFCHVSANNTRNGEVWMQTRRQSWCSSVIHLLNTKTQGLLEWWDRWGSKPRKQSNQDRTSPKGTGKKSKIQKAGSVQKPTYKRCTGNNAQRKWLERRHTRCNDELAKK